MFETFCDKELFGKIPGQLQYDHFTDIIIQYLLQSDFGSEYQRNCVNPLPGKFWSDLDDTWRANENTHDGQKIIKVFPKEQKRSYFHRFYSLSIFNINNRARCQNAEQEFLFDTDTLKITKLRSNQELNTLLTREITTNLQECIDQFSEQMMLEEKQGNF